MEWSACSDEYEKLVIRMTTPRFVSLKTFISLPLFFSFFFRKFFSSFFAVLACLFEFHHLHCHIFVIFSFDLFLAPNLVINCTKSLTIYLFIYFYLVKLKLLTLKFLLSIFLKPVTKPTAHMV